MKIYFIAMMLLRNAFMYSRVLKVFSQELLRLPDFWNALTSHPNQSHLLPPWALAFLESFPWSAARLEAFLRSALAGEHAQEPEFHEPSDASSPRHAEQEREDVCDAHIEPDDDIGDVEDDDACYMYTRGDSLWERWSAEWEGQRDDTPDRDSSPYIDWCGHADPSFSMPAIPQPRVPTRSVVPTLRKPTKYGRCLKCQAPRKPWVFKSGANQGVAAWVCTKLFCKDGTKCFTFQKMTKQEIDDQPRFFRTMCSSLTMRLKRGGRNDEQSSNGR
eukprot:s3651_g1.t1